MTCCLSECQADLRLSIFCPLKKAKVNNMTFIFAAFGHVKTLFYSLLFHIALSLKNFGVLLNGLTDGVGM